MSTDSSQPNLDNVTRGQEQSIKEPSIYQGLLFSEDVMGIDAPKSDADKLQSLIFGDLSFRGYDTSYASHDLHAFPAKFPPQLPRKFILGLTQPGDVVLDPMMGSGTTIVEAYLNDRRSVGFDIDPLARLITGVKTTSLDTDTVSENGKTVLRNATLSVQTRRDDLQDLLDKRWDGQTRQFVEYWFAKETQIELMALLSEIEHLEDTRVKDFMKLAFSACIITKSGGVSLAFDLAHTRPHRAKVVFMPSGELILGDNHHENPSPRTQFLTKTLRSPLVEFQKRLQQNIKSLFEIPSGKHLPHLNLADAQNLPLEANTVDLIVTSPPYASNAIDYMRAHKFSLVWLGYTVDQLTSTRSYCIGGENTASFSFEELPPFTESIVVELRQVDDKKADVLHRYYSEMSRVLRSMYRVLKPRKTAILVVATSTMRNTDTQTQNCLAEIGREIGFDVPAIGVRYLDRNRRMMPAGITIDHTSQIQQRMHEEFVLSFYKPS
ncbi:MAG: DNA methyltransferase [Anaerolineae bacterium]